MAGQLLASPSWSAVTVTGPPRSGVSRAGDVPEIWPEAAGETEKRTGSPLVAVAVSEIGAVPETVGCVKLIVWKVLCARMEVTAGSLLPSTFTVTTA